MGAAIHIGRYCHIRIYGYGYRLEMFADGRFVVTVGSSSAEAKNLDELVGILSGVRLGTQS